MMVEEEGKKRAAANEQVCVRERERVNGEIGAKRSVPREWCVSVARVS